MKIVAFKTGKPKSFGYKPVWYDKEKEEMEERLKKYKEPEQAESERLRSRLRETFSKRDAKNRQMSNRTFYIYIIAVLVLIYYIFLR